MFEGRIFKDEFSGRIIVDAEPQVMSKVRALFDNASTWHGRGIHTHKVLAFPFTMNSCKDIIWLMQRFNLDCESSLLSQIQDRSDSYDKIRKSMQNADKNSNYQISDKAIPIGLPLMAHQVQFKNMHSLMKRMLLADKLGLGKTASAISTLQEPESRPALVVSPPYLCTQWEREIKRFLPGASTHIIKGFKNYDLPNVDVLITSYNRLSPWQDRLINFDRQFKSLIMDEVHELRHIGTNKRNVCRVISETTPYVVGLSATPIFNMGEEIWSVMDVISPNCLGDAKDFNSEWASWSGAIREPSVLHKHLKNMGLILRRSPEDIGLTFGKASKHIITLDADIEQLEAVENVNKMLAMSVLSGNVSEETTASAEFDWKLRKATGLAKARPVAEFVKMLVEQEGKILLCGWHRDCYDIWMKELKDLKPVMYTGSETQKQKEEAINEFVNGESNVFILSLRSGAGIDGLQKVCKTAVFGELDWSPHVHDQCIGRLDRHGQTQHVQAFFLSIPDGSDPFMVEIAANKRSQHKGLVEGQENEAEILSFDNGGKERVREMAKSYLKSIGEEIPEFFEETGLLKDVADALRSMVIPNSTEEEMQTAIFKSLPALIPNANIVREAKISKRSRIDFLITQGEEKIGVECKITATNRTAVYRQVRKYIEEGVTSVMLLAPWHGISKFKVDNVPVIVIDSGKNHI